MPSQHTEHAFEAAIEHHLTTADEYVKGEQWQFEDEARSSTNSLHVA